MCACQPGFTCSRCRNDPRQDDYRILNVTEAENTAERLQDDQERQPPETKR